MSAIIKKLQEAADLARQQAAAEAVADGSLEQAEAVAGDDGGGVDDLMEDADVDVDGEGDRDQPHGLDGDEEEAAPEQAGSSQQVGEAVELRPVNWKSPIGTIHQPSIKLSPVYVSHISCVQPYSPRAIYLLRKFYGQLPTMCTTGPL